MTKHLETKNDLSYKMVLPDKQLKDFVESFWILHNPTDKCEDVVVLPEGRRSFFSPSR